MKIIADSGSTKTDWRLVGEDGAIEQCVSEGLNPLFLSEERFISIVHKAFPASWLKLDVSSIHFYGAGCAGSEQIDWVKVNFSKIYPAANVQVNSDMLGAAISVCGNQAGIVGILGTGSNCCLFDGQKIVSSVPPLGYILGDEGSGSALGKAFLKAYLRNELPSDLVAAFDSEYNGIDFLQKIYTEEKPNEFLASLALFLGKHQSQPFVANLVANCFNEFLEVIDHLTNGEKITINFVGSIAYSFNGILSNTVKSNGYQLGKIAQSPIAGLTLHYLDKVP